ncbi:uncharacterized protein LOC119605676 [Lucilia sericata]|uniref:uncharacterized protein LOC119605676 n=1 Tax=Lucilia sericata TaxID=13632 RepID=UPI0018A85B3B|nr:uncharacterized protein LOC119605676 [Lucilia sericata]
MKLLIALSIFIAVNLSVADLNVVNQENTPQNTQLPSNGVAVDEVVVESSLYIKPKQQRPQLRRVRRSIFDNFNFKSLVEHKRVKRQFNDYSQSQAAANAAAQQNYNNLFGFGNSAANAQSQAFNSQGPLGGFGASAAGTLTQATNGNKFGVQNSAGASHALTFNLPNGQSVNFASTNNFANAPGGNSANSRGSAVSVNRI